VSGLDIFISGQRAARLQRAAKQPTQ